MKVLIAAGGTAGHINPALAIADKIKDIFPESNIMFVGSPNGMEAKLVKTAGYDFYPIKMSGLYRSLSPSSIKHNISAVRYYLRAKPEVKKLLNDFNPDICIGTGGYVCAPLLEVASKNGISTLTHESNSYPGATTKMLSSTVDKILLGSEDCKKHLKHNEKCVITGNPLRSNVPIEEREAAKKRLGLPDGLTILSSGGSLGANKITEAVVELMKWEQKKGNINHIHSFGKNGKEIFRSLLEKNEVNPDSGRLILREYIDNMYTCICAADLIISRAGSMSITEITTIGRASILVPYPYATENHQYYNAKTLSDANAAILVEDKDLTGSWLIKQVSALSNDPERLSVMSENSARLAKKNAADLILGQIIDLLRSKGKL